jgi:acyl-CoA synthetase (AMP-forming)/AMP-acid ligase II
MNIPELLEKQAAEQPAKVYLYFNDQTITYKEFNLTANRVANAFRKMGARKGSMAAIMLPNCPEYLFAWMGLNKLAAVEVPVNTNFKGAELKYILQHAEVTVLVIHESFYPFAKELQGPELPKLKHIVYLGTGEAPGGTIPFETLLNESSDFKGEDISDDDPAVCIYTSGTTDRPKGVMNSHRGWVLTGQSYAYTVGITESDTVMTPNPLFHANAQVYSTMGSLAAGASLVVLEKFSGSMILDQARRYHATKLVVVQAVTPWIWNQPVKENDGDNPVRTMVAGNVPQEYYFDFEKRFNLKIQTIYSLTEAVMAVMGPREGTQPRKPGGIGVPMGHPDSSVKNEVIICNESGQEVPPGERGEIIIRNPAVMIGYYKDRAKTAETKEDGWIHTGDIGYRDADGYFFFVGRGKDVIRRRGELISPAEIEAVVNGYDKVAECAVIGVPSGLGTGEEEVKAYVRLKEGMTASPAEIVDWCTGKLGEFKIPRYVEFRIEFPKSAIGRIQKNTLKKEKSDLTEGCYDRLKA